MINAPYPRRYGRSVFRLCCLYGFTDCIEYLLSLEKNYQTKVDIFSHSGLMEACWGNKTETIFYLVENVYHPSKVKLKPKPTTTKSGEIQRSRNEAKKLKSKNKGETEAMFDINAWADDWIGTTAINLAARANNVEVMKLLAETYKDNILIEIEAAASGYSPFGNGMFLYILAL